MARGYYDLNVVRWVTIEGRRVPIRPTAPGARRSKLAPFRLQEEVTTAQDYVRELQRLVQQKGRGAWASKSLQAELEAAAETLKRPKTLLQLIEAAAKGQPRAFDRALEALTPVWMLWQDLKVLLSEEVPESDLPPGAAAWAIRTHDALTGLMRAAYAVLAPAAQTPEQREKVGLLRAERIRMRRRDEGEG